jgi:hypothetical protein
MPETSADFAFRFWWTSPIQRTSAHASMHHSFCCANYKNSKFKDFKQSRKLSIMLICPLVRKKERKKTCDCNHSCHDLTRICAVITQHCEGSWKSDDRQTLSALFLLNPADGPSAMDAPQFVHSEWCAISTIMEGCTHFCLWEERKAQLQPFLSFILLGSLTIPLRRRIGKSDHRQTRVLSPLCVFLWEKPWDFAITFLEE